jgi:hypothetical protein
MVYSQKFVACVLVNGVPQRELANGTVPIPFGVEYALRFRNKHDRRAVVQIFIDGENVSGAGYVIQPRSSIDIRRHSGKDVAFKFVSLDSPEAIDHGKNGPNQDKVKGTIEARFFLEKQHPPATTVIEHHHHHYPKPVYPRPVHPWWGYYPDYGTWYDASGTIGSLGSSSFTMASSGKMGAQASIRCMSAQAPATDALMEGKATNYVAPSAEALKDGCTVEGGLTGQSFWQTNVDLETDYISVKLFLQGYDAATIQGPTLLCESSKKSGGKALRDLERENEDLRRRIAEMEREQLERKLKRLSKTK